MKRLVFTLLLALVLWTVMFSPWTAPHVPFWWTMAGSALTLCILSTCFNPGWWRQVRWSPSNILLGVLIAVGLWLVFWTGDKVSAWLFDFARPPAEEIFWRGYVQRTLSLRWGANAGFAVSTLCYALVHAGACNFMLLMSALVAGVVWGGLYRFFPERFAAIILSHALWDVAVFIWFPI